MEEIYTEEASGGALQRIMTWAGMGTPRQFYLEVASKVVDSDYEAELEGDVITCYRVEKHGVFRHRRQDDARAGPEGDHAGRGGCGGPGGTPR
ncbi:MAG: hypothetical protein U9R48_02810 [Chloroflexota bacterium]|nr:hypothetical protein [Chloroflexota bacterium]